MAAATSWPSSAYILFNYKASNVYLPDYNKYVTFTYQAACGGWLNEYHNAYMI